jgi:hypothetical protein
MNPPRDWQPDDDAEDEWPDDDPEFDETPRNMPCPKCRKMMDIDAWRCPHCGEYIPDTYHPRSRLRWLLVLAWVLVALALAGYVLSLV